MIEVLFWIWLSGCFLGALWCGIVWVNSRVTFGCWPDMSLTEAVSIIGTMVFFWPITILVALALLYNKIVNGKGGFV